MSGGYGNLSFSEYTFETAAEKVVVALQAAMKVSGYTDKSPSWRILQRLKKSLKRDTRYSFVPSHKEKVLPKPSHKTDPAHQLEHVVSASVSTCLGLPLNDSSVKSTSAGYGVVTTVCVGPLSSLLLDSGKGPLTDVEFRANVVRTCLSVDDRFSSLRVSSVYTKFSKKKKQAMVTVETIYK